MANVKQITQNDLSRMQAKGVFLPRSAKYLIEGNLSEKQAEQYATLNDAVLPNSGVSDFFTTAYNLRIFEQLQIANTFPRYSDEMRQGDFATSQVRFRREGLFGRVAPYSDVNTDGVSDANINEISRDVFIGQTMITYGDLEEARNAAAQINVVDLKRRSATNTITQFLANLKINGLANLDVRGMLTDSSLPAAVAVATPWNDASATPNIIADDILNDLMQPLLLRGQGNFEEGTPKVFVAAPEVINTLRQPTENFLNTSRNWMEENFPQIELVADTRYKIGGVYYAQLFERDVLGERIIKDLFTYRMRSHGLIKYESHYTEKWSFGDSGAGITYPVAVSTISGVYTAP